MTWHAHRTAIRRSRRSRRLLPGHALRTSSPDLTPLPGVDPAERLARRAAWGHEQTWRFDRSELTGRITTGLAVAVMVLVLLLVSTSSSQPLERAVTAQAYLETVQTQSIGPVSPSEPASLTL